MNEIMITGDRQIFTNQRTWSMRGLKKHDRKSVFERVLLFPEQPTTDNIKRELEEHLYSVTMSESGAATLGLVKTAVFDVILCNVVPGFPAHMFNRALQAVRPHMLRRVIFVTGHEIDPNINNALRSASGIVLWRPVEFYMVLEAIEAIIKKSGLVRHDGYQ